MLIYFYLALYEPKKIRESLDTMVRIGFEEHLYIDPAQEKPCI